MPVNLQDHCIGLHASALVRDGGTLQIGIGSMGDALTAALLLRQRDNATYRALIDELGCVRAGPRRSSAMVAWSRSAGGSRLQRDVRAGSAGAGRGRRAEPPGHPDEARQRAAERGEAPEEDGGGCTAASSSVRWRSTGACARCRWKSAPIGMTGIGFWSTTCTARKS